MGPRAWPILRADGTSLDWTTASYAAQVKVQGRSATARHSLENADQLEALIAAGSACWVLELRCPKTLLAQMTYDSNPEMTAKWDETEVDGELFVLPGLVAVEPLQLGTGGLNDLWGNEPIDIDAGSWLARGTTERTESLAASLLTFNVKDTLNDGEMEVLPDISSGDLRFNVFLSPSYFTYVSAHQPRDVQIAALIAAIGQIPKIVSTNDAGYPILDQIGERLRERDVRTWDEEAGADFDPAKAATVLEPFHIPLTAGEDE